MDEIFTEPVFTREGHKILSHIERLSAVETVVAVHTKAIDAGFSRLEGWIKVMIGFGVGTILSGFGSLAYKVIIYDVEANRVMIASIERAVQESEKKTLTQLHHSEDKIHAQIETLKASTTSEILGLGRLLEQSGKKR